MVSIHYRQTIDGLPVLERSLVVNVTSDGTVKSINNDLNRTTRVRRGTISNDAAVTLAMHALSSKAGLPQSLQAHSKPERGFVVHGSVATEVIDVHMSRKPLSEHVLIRIHGTTGQVLTIKNQLIH